MTLTQVALYDSTMRIAFAPFVVFLPGLSAINTSWDTLRVHFSAPVQKMLQAHHVLDWTSLSTKELNKKLRSEFRLSAALLAQSG